MKFVKVDEVPRKCCEYHDLQGYLKEFMSMGIKTAKIDFGGNGYKSSNVACCCIHRAIKLGGLPIKVTRRGDDIYLTRKDM